MACARRSLTSGFNHLSRRFHPSLSHVISHDRDDRSDPPHPPLTPPSNFRSNPNTNPSVPFSLPFGLQPFLHRSYSSSPSVPSAEGSNDAGYINDVADVLTDPIIDASSTVTAAASAVPAPFPGEVAAAAADSYLPVAALEHVIDAVHSFTGLNWWASIAITTILIRGATLPLLLNQMRATVKLNAMRPEMEELKERMGNSMDPRTMMENQKRMKELFKKHGVTPFTPLKGLFIQGPIFISFFMAISNMVEKVPSFKGGGAFWFTDLTTPDPFYALPILTAVAFLATVELNMQEGMEGNPMAGTMKKFSRGLGVLTVPFTASFPKAIFCYWITSNIFSLVYGLVLKRPQVRKFLNLPDMTLPTNSTPQAQPDFSFFSKLISPSSSSPPSLPANQSEPVKSPSDRKGSSSSAVISQRIRNLEKTVKSRNKPKKKRQ